MNKFVSFFAVSLVFILASCGQTPEDAEFARLEDRAQRVEIIRDNWGIPHIYAKTDADAVFGMVYAQAEDDFNRIEMNYLNSMGRLAETEGEGSLYKDLRMRLITGPEQMKAAYAEAPQWLKDLSDAFADGMNFYLATHPDVTPKVIEKFEPWMTMSYTEGSIGWDIERVSVNQLENFYGSRMTQLPLETSDLTEEPQGSNGFAIAPELTANGNALLLINPHTSFYYRAEVHMVSEEGLNAYGATTWGQFFIYQGFNEKLGFMHTSSRADVMDEYLETIDEREDGLFYLHGGEWKPVETKEITLAYKAADGSMAEKSVGVHYTHHGPVIREQDGKWVSVQLMNEPVTALMQSYMRNKAQSYADYLDVMEMKANSSNNTVYADADGNIGYWHGNFIPRRDTSFDWSKPVDGANPATDWQGLHEVSEIISLKNPGNGWLMNTNNWPFSAAGEFSPKKEDYPEYFSHNTENPRGIHAIEVLEGKSGFTLQSLIDAAYDSRLPAFDRLLPTLFAAYEFSNSPTKSELAEAIDLLKAWDKRFGVESVATSVAIYWGRELMRASMADAQLQEIDIYDYMANYTTPAGRLGALRKALATLQADFGDWHQKWGDINRFQRLTGDIVQPFDDAGPSIPVAFTSARWGSLAAYGQRTFTDAKKNYGTRGNSFVAVVEFGDKVKARAISAGGQSGDVTNPHFNDQAERYATGNLRDVYFYREDVVANAEETYHPGQR